MLDGPWLDDGCGAPEHSRATSAPSRRYGEWRPTVNQRSRPREDPCPRGVDRKNGDLVRYRLGLVGKRDRAMAQ